MNLWHPSRGRWIRWLEKGRPSRLERHLAACHRCTSAVEDLVGGTDGLRELMAEALAPAEGFEQRTRDGLRDRTLDPETLAIVGDLLGLGFTTSKVLIEDESEEDR